MTAHSARALRCACGSSFLFPEFHWPHCPKNPNNMSAAVKKELPFTKAQLADIANHGPQRDEPTRKRKRPVKK